MGRPFSLGHLTAITSPPPQLVRVAAETGYDMVSLRIVPFGSPSYDLAENKAMYAATKAALGETKLPVLDVELARILPDVAVASYKPYLEIAAEFGAKHMTTSFWSPDHALVADKLCALCDLAQPYGVTINVEYLPFVDIGRLEDQLAIIEAVARNNCGLLIDSLFVKADMAPIIPRTLLHLMQLTDGPAVLPPLGTAPMFAVVRGGRSYLGEGEIDVASLVKSVPPMPCSLEIPNDRQLKELGVAGHARRCLETAKAYFARHGIGAAWRGPGEPGP